MSEIFVDYVDSDRSSVMRLLKNQPFKEAIWEWQYLQNPHAILGSSLILLKIDGVVAGFNGTMPVRLVVDGRKTSGIWSCDTFIDNAWRGKGLGQKLFAAVEQRAPIVLGYGISDMAYPLLIDKNGWSPSRSVEVYFLRREVRTLRDAAKVAMQWRAMIPRRQEARWEVAILPAEEMPGDVDDLWKSVEDGYQRTVVRDFAYLNWKYGCHPAKPYEIVTLRDHGVLVAVGIVRDNGREARLVDYVGPREQRALKSRLLAAFADCTNPKSTLSVSTSDEEMKSCLIAYGYLRYRIPERFAVWTTEPIERPSDDWFIMRGDSDGDLLDACKS